MSKDIYQVRSVLGQVRTRLSFVCGLLYMIINNPKTWLMILNKPNITIILQAQLTNRQMIDYPFTLTNPALK